MTDELQFVAAGVDGDDPIAPRDFVLHPSYPNPFNASTRVTIDVPTPGLLDLIVYDVLGRHVGSLHTGAASVGHHAFDWSPRDAGSGVYFIVAKLNNTTRVQKALLLK